MYVVRIFGVKGRIGELGWGIYGMGDVEEEGCGVDNEIGDWKGEDICCVG